MTLAFRVSRDELPLCQLNGLHSSGKLSFLGAMLKHLKEETDDKIVLGMDTLLRSQKAI